MNPNHYTSLFRGFVAVALILSVVLNFTLFSKVNMLTQQVNQVWSQQSNIENTLSGQTGTIQNALDEFKEEQSWISPINMELDTEKAYQGTAEATFTWQVKELQNGSKVVFNYVYGNNEEYTALPAEEVNQGLFRVKVPLTIKMEPHWEIGVISSNYEEETGTDKLKVEDKKIVEERESTMKYFISVSYEDTVKSSDVHTEHLGQVGMDYYGVVQTDIDLQDKSFSVSLVNHNISESFSVVEEANLLIYKGEELKKKEKLVFDERKPDDSVRAFLLHEAKSYENMRLVLEVTYSDGASFKKEIYNQTE